MLHLTTIPMAIPPFRCPFLTFTQSIPTAISDRMKDRSRRGKGMKDRERDIFLHVSSNPSKLNTPMYICKKTNREVTSAVFIAPLTSDCSHNVVWHFPQKTDWQGCHDAQRMLPSPKARVQVVTASRDVASQATKCNQSQQAL